MISWFALRALLRRVPGIAWVIAFAALFVALGVTQVYQMGRARGVAETESAALRTKMKHDVQILEYRDTVVLHDTVRLTKYLTRYDTVRATLNVHDTIQVRAFVAAADSTIASCRETVTAFALSCAAKDSVIHDLNGLLALRVPEHRGPTMKQRLAWALVGATLDEVARRGLRR